MILEQAADAAWITKKQAKLFIQALIDADWPDYSPESLDNNSKYSKEVADVSNKIIGMMIQEEAKRLLQQILNEPDRG